MGKTCKIGLKIALCCALLFGMTGFAAGASTDKASVSADAAVSSTPEAAGGADCVYVAGNPDWYPIEYYNPDTKAYEGILPELLEQIGQKTGLKFTYICAGTEDQRFRLAKNDQVEIVSGCSSEEEELKKSGLAVSKVIFTIPQEDKEIKVCFAFSKIAESRMVNAVQSALSEISQQDAAGIAIRFFMETPEKRYPKWLLAVGFAVFVALIITVVVLALRLRAYKKAAEQDDWYDLVTGIGNKTYFTQYFEKFISDQYRSLYCVIFIGFDIVRVNQYYGEAEAEEQLQFAANELMLSTADNEIAARVSGGGFAVARLSESEQEAATWTEGLLIRLNHYNEKYGKDYRPDFHAGIYMLQPSDRDCETVLFNAQQGYRQAVDSDSDYEFSHAELLKQDSEQLQLKKQVLEAIQNREFQMFLQFTLSGTDGKIIGAEALSRWDHPQKGLLYPGSYIGLMESERTISELDFYIFEEVCRQLEKWQEQGRDLSISCNFARITIDHENFIPRLKMIADQYSFQRSNLVVEITEDSMENNKEIAFNNVSRCKELGFRIALDDAGSGYTSFSDLRDYPIDIVKIDRTILNSAINPRGIALLEGMIALAHSLKMEVLCEGVETAEQKELLLRLGCDYMQGYYFYRALPQEEANRFLNENEKYVKK